MKLRSIILKIAEKLDRQRSLNAILHILRGKRSGQTLLDADTFSVKPYFSILPKLSEKEFEEASNSLKAQNLLVEHENVIVVTEKGREAVRTIRDYNFNGWNYRGKERLFFQRLELLVQVSSQMLKQQFTYIPISEDRQVQQFIKDIILHEQLNGETLAKKLADELIITIQKSGMTSLQATIFTHRLSGFGETGWTWEQLEEATGVPMSSLQLEWLEALHMLVTIIIEKDNETSLSLINKLTEHIQIETPLTESTRVTKNLFDQGRTIQEIADLRRLKLSTIEDHITEIAANIEPFPIHQFVSEEDISLVQHEVKVTDVKRLRILKEKFQHLTYFQLRLIVSLLKGRID